MKTLSIAEYPVQSSATVNTVQFSSFDRSGINNIPSIVEEVICSNGKPLQPNTREYMESRFNYDFNKVRIHSNSLAAKSAELLNARAYTIGNDIVFGQGENNSKSDANSRQRLLAHELTHVVQQNRVYNSASPNSFDTGLEREAEYIASTIIHKNCPVSVKGRTMPRIARQAKTSKSKKKGSTLKGGHKLVVTVVRFNKPVMQFSIESGGMTASDHGMEKRFGEWAVHTEPKAMIKIFKSGIPLDVNTKIHFKGILNPCNNCISFLDGVVARYGVFIDYESEYIQRKHNRKKFLVKSYGYRVFTVDRGPGKRPDLDQMVKYEKDVGRGHGRKAAGMAAAMAIMKLGTDIFNQQQKAAITTELLKIGPKVREFRRKYPNYWIVIYGVFEKPPQELLPQLEGEIAPAPRFRESGIVLANSIEDALVNKIPTADSNKFKIEIIKSYPPINDESKANSNRIDELTISNTELVIDSEEKLGFIIAALDSSDRIKFLDVLKENRKPELSQDSSATIYRVSFRSLSLQMPPVIYDLARTAVEISVSEYVRNRINLVGQFERKVMQRLLRLQNQSFLRKIWQSSIFDIDEALENSLKKVSQLKIDSWKLAKGRKYESALNLTKNAITELDIVWKALNQYEFNQIGRIRDRPIDTNVSELPFIVDNVVNQKKLDAAHWFIRKAKRIKEEGKPLGASNFANKNKPVANIFDDKNNAIAEANRALNLADYISQEEKHKAFQNLSRVIGRIELAVKETMSNETKNSLMEYKRQLLKKATQLMGG